MTDVVSFTIQPIVVQFLKTKLLLKDDTKDTTVTKTLSHSLLLYIYAIHHSAVSVTTEWGGSERERPRERKQLRG